MKKEEDYHVEQTKTRSKIRLIERREKPIDILAKGILLIEAFDADDQESASGLASLRGTITDPVDIIENQRLSVEELDAIIQDADSYLQLEQRKKNVGSSGNYSEFWLSLKEVAAGERKKKRLEEQRGSSSRGPHKAVEREIGKVFAGKNASQLRELSEDIMSGIKDGSRADVEYWEIMADEALLEASRLTVRYFPILFYYYYCYCSSSYYYLLLSDNLWGTSNCLKHIRIYISHIFFLLKFKIIFIERDTVNFLIDKTR